MRYQSKVYRSQSYAQRESLTRELRDNKENKENSNHLNLQPNKTQKPRDACIKLPLCQPKLEQKVSTSTTTSLVSCFLKKDSHPNQLKRLYTDMVVKDYSIDILTYFCQSANLTRGMLDRHDISSGLRSKMVDWMIEVLSSYKMTEQTFFRSIFLMDSYLKKSQERLEVKDLHLIGVTAMFSAAKYEEIHPLKLSVIYDKIARKKFKKTQILDMESDIVNALDFRIENSSIYDIARHAVQQLKLDLVENSQKYFQKIILYLSKMVLFNNELSEQNPVILGGAVIFIGLKTLEQVDPSAEPQARLPLICDLLDLKQDTVIDLSRQVLDLAKNFSKYYPTLNNLKKFNKFQYGHD